MRYKVFYGTSVTAYAVCYGDTKQEARYQFSEYNPGKTILRVEEFPDDAETGKDLLALIADTDPKEAIRHLVDAIEAAGVTHRVASYLRRHGFDQEDE